MDDCYVYLHRRTDNQEVFYVGRGRGNRAYNTIGRNNDWWAVVHSAGYAVEIAMRGLDPTDSKIFEAMMIAEHLEKGSPLVNRNTLLRRMVHSGNVENGDTYYKWKNVAAPARIYATVSLMAIRQGSDPLELMDVITGRSALTTDGWFIDER